jgi:hypothetical protein
MLREKAASNTEDTTKWRDMLTQNLARDAISDELAASSAPPIDKLRIVYESFPEDETRSTEIGWRRTLA